MLNTFSFGCFQIYQNKRAQYCSILFLLSKLTEPYFSRLVAEGKKTLGLLFQFDDVSNFFDDLSVSSTSTTKWTWETLFFVRQGCTKKNPNTYYFTTQKKIGEGVYLAQIEPNSKKSYSYLVFYCPFADWLGHYRKFVKSISKKIL